MSARGKNDKLDTWKAQKNTTVGMVAYLFWVSDGLSNVFWRRSSSTRASLARFSCSVGRDTEMGGVTPQT